MSPDRRDDEKDRQKKPLARIVLTSRPPVRAAQDARSDIEGTLDDDGLNIVQRKEAATAAALERTRQLQQKKEEETAQEEPSVLAEVLAAQERAAQQAVTERQRDSMRAVARARAYEASPAQPPKATPSTPPVMVRPSVPPVVAPRLNFGPLEQVAERAAQAMEGVLRESKLTRDEAFRFVKYVFRVAEVREKLQAKIKEMINRPEYVSEVITLAIQIDQLSGMLRQLKDFMQNALDVDGNGVAKCNTRNVNGLRGEFARAADGIGRMPSNPPAAPQEAHVDTAYMMPDDRLIGEFARVKNTPRTDMEGADFDAFLEKLEKHWKMLIETTGAKVGLDTGYMRGVIGKWERKLPMFSQFLAKGPAPLNVRNEWNAGLQELTGVMARTLVKTESLYEPTYKDFLRQIDIKALDKELHGLLGQLRDIESELRTPRDSDPSLLGVIRGRLGGLMGKSLPPYRSRAELQLAKNNLTKRIVGVRKLRQQKEDLENHPES